MVVYLVLTGPALYKIIKFYLNPQSQEDTGRIELIEEIDSRDLPEIESSIDDSWFYYPKLGIKAPLQWDVSLGEVNQVMINGLVHVEGTAKPGENGDILISGHSSYYLWVAGDYKTVLAPLVRAETGDFIMIRRDKIYLYEVTEVREIRKTESLDFVYGGSEPGKLLIMTCVPIGTDINRLIVEAKLYKEI